MNSVKKKNFFCLCGHLRSDHAINRFGDGRFCSPCFHESLGVVEFARSVSDHYFKIDNLRYLEAKAKENE